MVSHHPLNCCMLGNVLGLFLGMGRDAFHGFCCWGVLLFVDGLCFVLSCAPRVGVCWFWLLLLGKRGEHLAAPYCIAAPVAAAGYTVIKWCFLLCRRVTLLHDHTGHHCSGPVFFAPFSWSQNRGKQPRASTLSCGGLNLGQLGGEGPGGGGVDGPTFSLSAQWALDSVARVRRCSSGTVQFTIWRRLSLPFGCCMLLYTGTKAGTVYHTRAPKERTSSMVARMSWAASVPSLFGLEVASG